MGITVRELLNVEYFRDFRVIAGKNGMNREIQGVTIADAPDGYLWKTEKELCFSSGYVFAENPEFILGSFQGESRLAALVIKRGRYLSEIPEYIIRLFNENDVPLITMPYTIPWMEAINQVYMAVINHAIQIFGVGTSGGQFLPQSMNYKEQKVQKILRTVESDMEFPALLYDLYEDKSYYSSANFTRITQQFGIQESDYWEPSIPHSRHTLCDSIHMTRYRLQRGEAAGQPKISWVTIPIMVGGAPQAYFCVMESRRFLDFCDEYSIRIAFMALQSVYEQIVALRDTNDLGFEQLLHLAMKSENEDSHRLQYLARQQGLQLSNTYMFAVFQHDHKSFDIRLHRGEIMDLLRYCGMENMGRMAFLSGNEGIILLRCKGGDPHEKQQLCGLLEEFQHRLTRKYDGLCWRIGFCYEPRRLMDIRSSVEKGRKVVKVGSVAMPDSFLLDYDKLGILTWLDIPDEELQKMLEDFQTLMQVEKNRELLTTLRVYLENNMNYSLTAEKLFVNINTIRRRIEKINELVTIDWDNYYSRTKIGLMLQFLQLS